MYVLHLMANAGNIFRIMTFRLRLKKGILNNADMVILDTMQVPVNIIDYIISFLASIWYSSIILMHFHAHM